MRLATGASVFMAAGLLACGPVSAAYATVESPSPAPSAVTDEPSEDAAVTPMTCDEGITDETVTIQFEPPATSENLTVTAAGETVAFKPAGDSSIVIDRTETDVTVLLDVWDAENQQRASCEVEIPRLLETSEPSESSEPEPTETADPSEPTDDPSTPQHTPTPEPPETQEPVSSPSPSPSLPAEPTSPAETSASPQPPVATTPTAPYEPQDVSSTPSGPSTSITAPSESMNAAESDRQVPRQIRPLAESPRYLLPQLLGMQSHRGSPLVMPGPRDADERSSELETLPPISEEELEAIKAELSSPGRADKTSTGAHLEGATPQERVSSENSWWLLAGLTSVVGISAVTWWVLNRRKRRH